jgi:acetolactate synthase-1/2/3 large subunit
MQNSAIVKTVAAENSMRSMNTADLLIRCLEKEGVKYIFGIPGEENLDLIRAISNSSIRFITTRHEQGAAFMADVYGRLTGTAGICMATLGPGATNLVTGVADANLDGSPLIAITGQVGTEKMHITSHQYLDLVEMFEPITKRSKQIVRPDTVTEIVRLAFKYAESEKPGAVHIDLPNNIAKMDVTGEPLEKNLPVKGIADPENIKEAVAAINRAKCPVIIAGSSAIRSKAGDTIERFAEQIHIPVVNTMMGKGIISWDNRYAIGTIGIPQKDYINQLFEVSDLVLGIGYDLVEYAPQKWNNSTYPNVVHIGTKAADINKNYQTVTQVVGDISKSIHQIMKSVRPKEEPAYAFDIKRQIEAEQTLTSDDDSFPIKPQRVISDIRKVMGREDILISDVGAHKVWIARNYNCYCPKTCIISNGFASMGIAVPGALAAKLVYPDKKVLAVTGDGGFLMNSQELETAVRIGTPFVTLIWNDGSYGLIKWKEMNYFHKTACVDFTNPDFVLYAQSMHCKGYRVNHAQELIPTLEEAFCQNVPAIIDCRIDYQENYRLTERLKDL